MSEKTFDLPLTPPPTSVPSPGVPTLENDTNFHSHSSPNPLSCSWIPSSTPCILFFSKFYWFHLQNTSWICLLLISPTSSVPIQTTTIFPRLCNCNVSLLIFIVSVLFLLHFSAKQPDWSLINVNQISHSSAQTLLCLLFHSAEKRDFNLPKWFCITSAPASSPISFWFTSFIWSHYFSWWFFNKLGWFWLQILHFIFPLLRTLLPILHEAHSLILFRVLFIASSMERGFPWSSYVKFSSTWLLYFLQITYQFSITLFYICLLAYYLLPQLRHKFHEGFWLVDPSLFPQKQCITQSIFKYVLTNYTDE